VKYYYTECHEIQQISANDWNCQSQILSFCVLSILLHAM